MRTNFYNQKQSAFAKVNKLTEKFYCLANDYVDPVKSLLGHTANDLTTCIEKLDNTNNSDELQFSLNRVILTVNKFMCDRDNLLIASDEQELQDYLNPVIKLYKFIIKHLDKHAGITVWESDRED